MGCSSPGSSVHGILQARILEWLAILFSRGLANLGIEPGSPVLQADSLPTEVPGKLLLTLVNLIYMKQYLIKNLIAFF